MLQNGLNQESNWKKQTNMKQHEIKTTTTTTNNTIIIINIITIIIVIMLLYPSANCIIWQKTKQNTILL